MAAQVYLRRSAAWGTGLISKYQYDPFFRTQCNIIALQVVFALLIMSAIGGALTFLYQSALASTIAHIQESILNGSTNPTALGQLAVGQLDAVNAKTLWIIIMSGFVITILFGYIVTRIALGPTREALTSQKQFIGNIAHELRTPLSTIKMNTEVTLLDDHLEKRLRDTLLSNIEELDRVSDIINNLLTVNALVRPEHIEFKNVDLGPIADTVLRKLQPLVERKHITTKEQRADYRIVWGNPSALEQILTNILKNAILYTPDEGRVSLSIEPDFQGNIVVTVQDSGIGIAQKDLFRIFEPFYRGDSSRTRRQGGSGLGLTIVSELVHLHNGKITIQSAIKRGTTVTVLLPTGKNENALDPDLKKSDVGEIAVDFSSRT